ncbi:Gfo/Idh/MocA family oxidoreductase [Desulfobulbus sp.]|uniref:Gfo/Idh/MocA family oxidoreductase n=1 Tax=Desulfobulbus sp. TaxID=895 RepID=UPI00286F5C46|nr:Gfo/Idh/MocA family oxidoreductase [Desulfobulbus sp.]
MRSKPRVLVCGTNYGRFYLSAFARQPCDFELAGILAAGSARSQALARELGVPLYTKTVQLPGDIDMACVAVKSTLLGGNGTRIAMELLQRGIHVVQEHPLHPADLLECLRLSHRLGTHYHVNSHFVHVRAVQTFIDYVRQSSRHERPLFIDITTALPYSALDIVGQALGGLDPFVLHDPLGREIAPNVGAETGPAPFKCIEGTLAGIPVYLKIQHYFDPDDAVHNYLVMHRICIGSESGNVILLSPFGPVIWTQGYPRSGPAEQSSHGHTPDTVMARHFHAGHRAGHEPTTVQFTPGDAPSYADIFAIHWPEGIHGALATLRHAVESGEIPMFQSESYLVALAHLWVAAMRQCGKPRHVRRKETIRAVPDPILYREYRFFLDKSNRTETWICD